MTEPPHLTETRTAYNTVATSYADQAASELPKKPLERALLATFAELVGPGQVADLGCGPGRIAAHLKTLGTSVFGIDLSPEMVATAQKSHPGLTFKVGTMSTLDIKDEELTGIVAWYSIIHTPPPLLPTIFAEFNRVLIPGGHLILAFQAGENNRLHVSKGYGHDISLDAYRLSPDHITDLLANAGLTTTARLIREPEDYEKTQQAYLLARKPAEVTSRTAHCR
ncbi:class I SAM-dependent DNA methyltransferase [Amycolatopsis sp. H20-H5]|uniref:class I SAM-dependent DNA methyltransferase n=1 Tax=Amycolatopsis sp. H20-H5 TaxID=3046309 RepID=UPI002DB6C6FB|nr:class I SAM-dependent methyltransferase [Amycolatopsis sp. H20-H5]MEC3980432.1 class I SAM-dependent methyltransferase [Amycolatopsis sp. H20-H5]